MIEENGTLFSHILKLEPKFIKSYHKSRTTTEAIVCFACGSYHNFGVDYDINWDKAQEISKNFTREEHKSETVCLCNKCVGTKGPKTPDGKQYFTGDHLINFRTLMSDREARKQIKQLREERKAYNSPDAIAKRMEHTWLTNDIMEAWIEGAAKHPIIKNIKDTSCRTGKLSEKQIDLVKKLMRELHEPQKVFSEVPEGVMELTGMYQSVRVEPDMWNNMHVRKGLFIDDRGFKVWGTVPSCFSDMDAKAMLAAKITFTAEVNQSEKDKLFGFYKRPRNATVILD